jgi:PAS domain-containing protein
MFGVDSDRSGAHSGADDGHRLPAVLHTAPAAVLMIDPGNRRVVYANPAAIELTGERVQLPVDIERGATPRASPTSADAG